MIEDAGLKRTACGASLMNKDKIKTMHRLDKTSKKIIDDLKQDKKYYSNGLVAHFVSMIEVMYHDVFEKTQREIGRKLALDQPTRKIEQLRQQYKVLYLKASMIHDLIQEFAFMEETSVYYYTLCEYPVSSIRPYSKDKKLLFYEHLMQLLLKKYIPEDEKVEAEVKKIMDILDDAILNNFKTD